MKKSYDIVSYSDNAEDFALRVHGMLLTHKTFKLMDIPLTKRGKAIEIIENEMNALNLKCRVKKAKRGIAAGALMIGGAVVAEFIPPLGVGMFLAGAGGGAGIGAHDACTFSPDYEIVKDILGTGMVVEYKKK